MVFFYEVLTWIVSGGLIQILPLTHTCQMLVTLHMSDPGAPSGYLFSLISLLFHFSLPLLLGKCPFSLGLGVSETLVLLLSPSLCFHSSFLFLSWSCFVAAAQLSPQTITISLSHSFSCHSCACLWLSLLLLYIKLLKWLSMDFPFSNISFSFPVVLSC